MRHATRYPHCRARAAADALVLDRCALATMWTPDTLHILVDAETAVNNVAEKLDALKSWRARAMPAAG